MKYTIEQLGFILYNNRSVNGVIKNFLDKSIDPYKLIEIEKKFDWCKSLYSNLEKMVEVDLSLLDPNGDDVIIYPNQLEELTQHVLSNIGKFSQEIIGATCHPILRTFLKDGIDEGGIVFPLFVEDKLTNCSIRRITDVGKLKYTLAVPDVPVWGLSDINKGDEIWICEGIFDMISLREFGYKSVSPSSAMWSGIQLYQLVEKNPKFINIFCDNDRVGLKTGLVLSKFFNLIGLPSKTIHSKYCKDASEHLLEKKLPLNDFEEVKIDRKMVENKDDNSFDFLKYLQKRKF